MRNMRIGTMAIGMALGILGTAGAWSLARGAHDAGPPPPAPAPTIVSRAGLAGESFADVVKKVAPAVVTIRIDGEMRKTEADLPDDLLRRFFGEPFGGPQGAPDSRRHGLGSGVLVSADGYVLTNHHVVDGADRIQVDLLDGRTLDAKRVGSDAPSDLALLKIDAPDLSYLSLGDSDAVRVGDVVLAVGNPLGVGQTVTMGIISAKGRSTGVGDGSYEDFLQTDAPINRGNSGGALVNTQGELIGINSQIVSNSQGSIGIGFAIPANMAEHVMTALRTDGQVRRARLGVVVQPVTSDLAKSLGLSEVAGAIVAQVEPDSPAARAGVKQGDVITSLDGKPVREANTLRNRVAESAPGSRATLGIERDGETRELTVYLGELTASAEPGDRADDDLVSGGFGVTVSPLTPELTASMGLDDDVRGLLVRGVAPASKASDAGIEPGDVIEEVNRKPVDSADSLRTALHAHADRPALIRVHRRGTELYLAARLT